MILRELRHTSQRALARSTHGSTSHLSKYETGKALPKLETIERFLDVLDIQALDLFYLMAHLDGWERRIAEKQGVWVLPGSGILTARVSRSLREIVENLFAIQSVFVVERLQRVAVNEGSGGGEIVPELRDLQLRVPSTCDAQRASTCFTGGRRSRPSECKALVRRRNARHRKIFWIAPECHIFQLEVPLAYSSRSRSLF